MGNPPYDEHGHIVGMKPPRGWWLETKRMRSVMPWHLLTVKFFRQRYEDIVGEFSPGAIKHFWWSHCLVLGVGSRYLWIWLCHERWA